MLGLIAAISVIALFALMMGVMDMLFAKDRASRAVVGKRLESLRRAASAAHNVDIERRRTLSEVPWLNRALSAQSWTTRLSTMLDQGQVNLNVGTLVLVTLLLGSSALYVARLTTDNYFLRLVPPIACAYAPLMWVRRRKNKRMGKFQRQLPDALDLIARALKAGHAFPQGMRMVADEFADPIGPEFEKTLDEINFGISPDMALLNLTRRVDCPDLKFFVVSVNIQRETGGNLSEIVGNIASLVRERFKLEGKVRVLAAEGKLTAYILLALPFAVGAVISIINPEYMGALQETPEGRVLSTLALTWMGIGAAALHKLIQIKV